MNKPLKNETKKDKFEGVRIKLLEMQRILRRESKADISQILSNDDKYNGMSDDGDLADVACRDSLQTANLTLRRASLRFIELMERARIAERKFLSED